MYRPIKICPYCDTNFFPVPGQEDIQVYCKPSHRVSDWKRNNRAKYNKWRREHYATKKAPPKQG